MNSTPTCGSTASSGTPTSTAATWRWSWSSSPRRSSASATGARSGCSPGRSWSSGSASPRPSRSRASSPCSAASRCWRRCAGAGAGRWRRSSSARSAASSSSPWSAARGSTAKRLNVDTRGRTNLVSGGVDLFAERPLWGYGSGSFQQAYSDHQAKSDAPVTISHTEPVTVAAEQGLIGLAALRGADRGRAVDDGGGDVGAGAGPRPDDPRRRPRRGPRHLRRPAPPHPRLRGLLRGPDHLGAAGRRARLRRSALALARRPAPAPPARSATRLRLGAMSGYLRRLATTGAAYTAASILSKLIAVALLPLYTRHLTRGDYGAAELMFAAVVTASIVVRLGLIEALLRFYYEEGEDPDRVVRASFAGLFWLSTIGALVALPLAKPLSELVLDQPGGGAGADLDRRPLGADDDGIPAHPVPARGAGAGLLRHHDPQRAGDDRGHRRPRRRDGGGGARPPARQLRDRRRLRRRPDRDQLAPTQPAARSPG